MIPLPRPFRLVYRAFDAFEFDPAKSEKVFEMRGFDLAYAQRMSPGYALEREDTRENHGDPCFRIIRYEAESPSLRKRMLAACTEHSVECHVDNAMGK